MALSVFPRGTRIPKIDPKFLEPDMPQTAINAVIESGNLQPLSGLLQDTQLSKSGDLRSIFKLGSYWISWTQEVDVVKAQLSESDDRFFYTGDGAPKQSNLTMATSGSASTYPTSSVALGVTKPATIPTVNIYGTEDDTQDPVVISYVYTYVTEWGEESAPSELSPVTEIAGGKYVALSNLVDPGDSHITHFRVYRLISGSSSAEYQLVSIRPGSLSASQEDTPAISEIVSTATLFYDADDPSTPTGLSDDTDEVIPSEDWDEPPSDLANLVQFRNGILAGSTGNEVCFSEPLVPYAWPVTYRKLLDYDVVGLGVYKSNVIALTGVYPYVIQGNTPSQMTQERLEYKQGCVSKRGIVSTKRGVVYPSPDGLFICDGSTVINLTTSIYTKPQWEALGPEDLLGFSYDNSYYGFFEGTGNGFVLTLNTDQYGNYVPTLREFSLGTPLYGGYVDPETNTLCLLGLNSNYYVFNFGEGSQLTYTWKTKTFSSSPTNYAVAQIRGPFDSGSITVTPFFDGVEQTPITVSNQNFFWLPSGNTYRNFELKLVGSSEVDQIVVGHDPEELSSV